MTNNVGTLDRIVRIIFGLALATVPFTNFLTSDWVGQLLAGVAFVVAANLVLSGALASCFVYRILGINTCSAH